MENTTISTILSASLAIISIVSSYFLNLKSINASKKQLELRLKHEKKMRLVEKKIETPMNPIILQGNLDLGREDSYSNIIK